MASKGKGKGKNATEVAINTTNITKNYPGAVDSSYYIRARKEEGEWCDARIIGCKDIEGNR